MKAPLSSWRSSSIEGRWNAVVFIDFRDCNLLELSDAIAHFSSLKILELSGTNLKSLPSTMNRLDFLERLELEGCKRLKSIPELSSSISYINANNCTTLETISTPKRPYDMGRYFTFCNCWKLVQNDLFRDIVETHFPPQETTVSTVSVSMGYLKFAPSKEITCVWDMYHGLNLASMERKSMNAVTLRPNLRYNVWALCSSKGAEFNSSLPTTTKWPIKILGNQWYNLRGSLEGCSIEPSDSDIRSAISDFKRCRKLIEIFGGSNRNFREYDYE
ncbi:hypothetical protein M0R45_001941 [Rubus argutus]|uniref:Uncharacterized protein n=1 Tax=Rubus argutus TaxID=59490 RepID=A0AAW1VIJ2_RUBAR